MQEVRSATAAQSFDVASARAAAAGGSQTSAVAWGAILAGAAAALAATLVLLALGAGLGITTISPWPNSGASAATFGTLAAVWLILVQWLSSGLGGYLTGRLRTRWVGMHTHEVFFRDTAHGFLAWCIATIVATAIFASAVSSVVSGGTHAVASVAAGAAQGSAPTGYFVDSLFRSDNPAGRQNQDSRSEATRILATDLRAGQLPDQDRVYLAKLVASGTGLSQSDAERRVDGIFGQLKASETKARQVADTARKAAATFSIALALSMAIGAFIASVAAAFGGHLREEQ